MSIPMRSRNRRGEGERLRDEILDAAITLVDETNAPGSLTLRGIARRAGISAPSIYAHFPDLPHVVDEVLMRSFEELRATVAEAIAAEADPVRALVGAGRAYVEFAWRHKARYGLMFNAEGYAPNALETFSLVEGLIRRCVDVGRSDSINPHLDTWMLWAGMHGVATLDKPARSGLLRLGTLDRPAMLETIIQRLARIRTEYGETAGG